MGINPHRHWPSAIGQRPCEALDSLHEPPSAIAPSTPHPIDRHMAQIAEGVTGPKSGPKTTTKASDRMTRIHVIMRTA